MRIFVTGGTGFIGSHVVRLLADKSHEQRCLVRNPDKAQAVREVGAEIVVGDLTDKPSLVEGMRGCDAVVDIASLYEFWGPDRRTFAAINVEGTRNVMEAALESGATKVVHVSSVAVWGDAAWPITEATPLGPKCISEYIRSKRAGDQVAWQLHETRQLPLVMVYPGGVVGPDDPKAAGRYVRNFVRGAMPAQVLTGRMFAWVHVRDVAMGIVRALEAEGNVGERYILVAENMTFGDLNRLLAEISGVRPPRLSLPDWMAMLGSYCATGLANIIQRPPILDMAVDQIALMRQGFEADGSKASRELGLEYTPIRTALEEAVASL
jgi:dihydroflavonol-4-reductase